MEFTIKTEILKSELGFAVGVVNRKATIPSLQNVLIESISESMIRITGTDLDTTIRCDAAANIIKAGSICVPAGRLFDIVKLLDRDEVHFEKNLDTEWVKLTVGRSGYKLPGMKPEQFPTSPDVFKNQTMRISAEIFHYLIRNTSFAITNEQSRFTLSGAKLEIFDDKIRMVTTDGHRLSFIERGVGEAFAAKMNCLVPKKALIELDKILRETAQTISFGEDPNHIFFDLDGRALISRKLSGQFPDYNMVIPKDNDKAAIFDLEEMRLALRRTMLMTDERTRSIRLIIRENEVEIYAHSSEEGEGREFVQADYSGEEVELGFNSTYLFEYLNNLSIPEAEGEPDASPENKPKAERQRVSFGFKDANGQTIMRIVNDNDYDAKYVVMPLRI